MKVALLPRNIGSDLNYRTEALSSIGIDAKGYNFQESKIITNDAIYKLPKITNIYNPISRIINTLNYIKELEKIIIWADIVHWVYDLTYIPFTNYPIEFSVLSKYKKPGVIQWCGSDIRNYKIDIEINPYFKKAYFNGEWGYKESDRDSFRCQWNFYKLGFIPLEFIGMGHYIDSMMFPKTYRIFQLLGIERITPSFPKKTNKPLQIVHAPSNKGTKGSKYIIEAVNRLKFRHNIEFVLIENIPREKALHLISNCDIFIDQLIAGSHGSAAVEAMSMGKPVICYINEFIGKDYPKDLPIINANPDNIFDVLDTMIVNNVSLFEIGIRSRLYVEKYHAPLPNAENLKLCYEEILSKKK